MNRPELLLLKLLLCAPALFAVETNDVTWIDVRTAEEYAGSALPGHTNIPHTQIAERISSVVTDKDTPVYLYCVSGRRAGLAREALEKLGYTNVTNIGTIDTAQRCIRGFISC